MKIFKKAVAAVAIFSVLCGLLGCKKLPEYTVADIKSVSVSCGHMDYSHSYAFYLRKEENRWLLDAEFAKDSESPRIQYEAHFISDADANEILKTVGEQNVIEKLASFKEPKLKVSVSDETVYYTMLGFRNGENLGAKTLASKELTACFCRIAEKYCDAQVFSDIDE